MYSALFLIYDGAREVHSDDQSAIESGPMSIPTSKPPGPGSRDWNVRSWTCPASRQLDNFAIATCCELRASIAPGRAVAFDWEDWL